MAGALQSYGGPIAGLLDCERIATRGAGASTSRQVFNDGVGGRCGCRTGRALGRSGSDHSQWGVAHSRSHSERSFRSGSARAAAGLGVATKPEEEQTGKVNGQTPLHNGGAAIPVNGPATGSALVDFQKAMPEGKLSVNRIMGPVEDDLHQLNENLKSVVGDRHPMLMSAAEQIFGAGGKRMRPALVLLVARSTAQLSQLSDIRPEHRRLAEITEMIHTASLIHDDVLDNSDVRRGKMTVHQKFGTRVAVLAGDFLFAQSSWFLANLNNLDVIKLISQVIADFANGEIQQKVSLFDTDLTVEGYLEKSYFKTASLIAASLKSAAIFSDVSPAVCEAMFDYGKHLGLAFQVVDDILDFTQSTEQLGKPAGSDLASGNITAPALYALERSPRLRDLIDSEFKKGSLEEALQLVASTGGIDVAKDLAKREGELARQCLQCLPAGPTKTSLEDMIDYVLERLF